jgi:hypothetical protein
MWLVLLAARLARVQNAYISEPPLMQSGGRHTAGSQVQAAAFGEEEDGLKRALMDPLMRARYC